MAYETPITIKKTIDNIRKKQYVLPSIQREFVWDTTQVERLFDSLMRDYPISTFLFWKVEKHKIKDFQFYEFLQNYHQRNLRHNTKASLGNEEDIIAVLDGQQRMTSIYIGLLGSHATKLPYLRKENNKSYPKKKLYLNLLSTSNDIELEYDFRFLSKEQIENSDKNYWFRVGEILDFTDLSNVMEYLMISGLMDTSLYPKDKSSFALRTLTQLFNVIHQKGTISYYLEESEELDKVLQIFIRINSGGTKLSYSDLLLSIATAQWKEKDAREVIHEFVDEINLIGEKFDFNKDFVLKSCLVLADFKDIKFKVDNFTKSNMKVIEENWDKTATSITTAIELVSKYGYNRSNLTTSNAIIPIAYFIYKNNLEDNILHSSAQEDNRKAIVQWLARVILKGTFGGTPDAIYPVMRNLINEHLGRFPLPEIIEHYRGKRKSISFSEDDVENILDINYGKNSALSALSLLYSSLNYSFKYHLDHIHPKSFFTKSKLNSLGILDDKQKEDFISKYNSLSNLQLLQETTNIQKRDKPFKDWLEELYPNETDRMNYLMQNHITSEISLEFAEFVDFYDKRREILKGKYMQLLNIKKEEASIPEVEQILILETEERE